MQERIRVGIADDHAITRYGLARFIENAPDMLLAGEASSGREAMRMVAENAVDVLVLDLMMPGTGGLDVLRSLRLKLPDLKLIVLSNYPPEQYAVNVLRLGAHGFLSKQSDPEDLFEAIRTVAAGRHAITPAVARLIAEASRGAQAQLPHARLSDREFQLMLHFASGIKTQEIAQALCLSPRTIMSYRGKIMKSLGLKTTSELTHYAMKSGLLD